MTSSFKSKIIYMGIAVLIFAAMFPVRDQIQTVRSDPRWRLSEERLATPGDVDTTSAIALLVLGGLRGVATNLLWSEVLELQREKMYTELEPVVGSIIKLQPHFINVWTFQSWNLAYNIAADWDAVEDKYYWIKRGIEFSKQGVGKNEHDPDLRWNTGWVFHHKLGKSDEKILLRAMYREDIEPRWTPHGEIEPFNEKPRRRIRDGKDQGEDNYESAYTWFQSAVDKCDELETKSRRMGNVPFRSYPALARTNFAKAVEAEGTFGEIIQKYWLEAAATWKNFAEHDFEVQNGRLHVWLDYGPEVYDVLNDSIFVYYTIEDTWKAGTKDFAELDGELQRRAFLNPAQAKELWTKGFAQCDEAGRVKVVEELNKLVGLADKFASSASETVIQRLHQGGQDAYARMKAAYGKILEQKERLTDPANWDDSFVDLWVEYSCASDVVGRTAHEELYWSERYGKTVNYNYWKLRSLCEAELQTIDARENFYLGGEAYRTGDPDSAVEHYNTGLKLWEAMLEKYPQMREENETVAETYEVVMELVKVRRQLDLPELEIDEMPFSDIVKKRTPMTAAQQEQLQKLYELWEKQKDASGSDEGNPAGVPIRPEDVPKPDAPAKKSQDQ